MVFQLEYWNTENYCDGKKTFNIFRNCKTRFLWNLALCKFINISKKKIPINMRFD